MGVKRFFMGWRGGAPARPNQARHFPSVLLDFEPQIESQCVARAATAPTDAPIKIHFDARPMRCQILPPRATRRASSRSFIRMAVYFPFSSAKSLCAVG